VGRYGLDASGSGQASGSCDHGNELSSSVIVGKFLN
jgi:hypothetical protein